MSASNLPAGPPTTDFEQQVTEALRGIFAAMRLTIAGRQDDVRHWSADDLATDLAPRVTAALEAALYWSGLLPVSREVDDMSGAERIALMNTQGREAFLRVLRGETS